MAVTGFLVWASACIGSGVYLKSYCRGNCKEKYVALTFDDGPSPMTGKVLDVLKEHNVKAGFFLIGSKIVEDRETVRRIADEGHIIGNHTWSHTPGFPLKSYADVVEEIRMTSDVVYETIGMVSVFAARSVGVDNVVLTGNLTRLGFCSEKFDYFNGMKKNYGVNFIIPERSEFATVIGTAIHGF